MQRKVLFVLPTLSGGGAERVMVHLLNAMTTARCLTPILVVGVKRGVFVNRLPENLKVVELGSERARTVLWRLHQVIKKEKPDVVLSTLGMNVAVCAVSMFSGGKFRVVSRLGNTVSAYLRDAGRKGVLPKAFEYLKSYMVAKISDAIICQSQFMMDDFVHAFPSVMEKCRVIYNPVNCRELDRLASEDCELKGTGLYIVSTGRMSYQKGHDILLDALSVLRADQYRFTCHIFGEGEALPSLEERSRRHGLENFVSFPGFFPNPYACMKRADVFVSASRYEGFANAILEAAALGVKIVASDCPGANREIKELARIRLFENENPADLCRALKEIIDNGGGRAAAPASSEKIRSRFDISKIAREYEKCLCEPG
ncbi:glycosyltransferase [Alkalilimnicola ehrlichii MLHE-1]|nr:glycosyltransferase [Alkalilimnicola ehrlichii]